MPISLGFSFLEQFFAFLIKKKTVFSQIIEHFFSPITDHLSAAWRSGSERRFYDDHDRKVSGSTPNLVTLLRPWIRCFKMIISAWWNLASSK